MPQSATTVDTTIQSTGIRLVSQGDICIIGVDAGGTAPDNIMQEATSLSEINTLFGSSSDIAKAAEKVFDQKPPKVFAIRLAKTDVTGESVTQGSLQTLANAPILGRPVIDIDSGAITNNFVYITPTAPAASNAAINTNTGGIWIDGAGSSSVDYSHFDLTLVAQALSDNGIDIAVLANSPGNAQFFGIWTSLLVELNSKKIVTVMMNDSTQLTVATTVLDAAEFSSRNVVYMAHKAAAGEDIAAAVAGLISVLEPADKLMWKILLGVTTAYYSLSELTTLEAGKVNAVILKNGQDRPSDGLTTVGGPDFKYIDIARIQYAIEDAMIDNVDITIQDNEIPFTAGGLEQIRSALSEALTTFVENNTLRQAFENDDGVTQPAFLIEIPAFSTIPQADKVDRILRNVFVTVFLAGRIQLVTINLALNI